MDNPTESFEKKLQEAITNPKNMGEMPDADSIGSPEFPAGKIKINITKPEDTP